MVALFDKFNDGGPFFSYPIMALLVIIVALFVQGLIKRNNRKTIALIASLSWFTVAWGFLGRTFGLIVAFDNISVHGEITPLLLGEGLKMAILNPLFAIVVFLIARLGIIILISLKKEEEFEKGDISY